MSVYKCDVVVVIKIGTYIHGVLILCGCLAILHYSRAIASMSLVIIKSIPLKSINLCDGYVIVHRYLYGQSA